MELWTTYKAESEWRDEFGEARNGGDVVKQMLSLVLFVNDKMYVDDTVLLREDECIQMCPELEYEWGNK